MKKLILITTLAILPVFVTMGAPGDLPHDYNKVALAAVKASLKDPDSLKELHILAGMPPSDMGRMGTNVFVVVNAKNSFGGYTGRVVVAVVFQAGRVKNINSLNLP